MTQQIAHAPVWQEYSLQTGFIHHWLVAGPLATPISNLSQYRDRQQIAADLHRQESGVDEPPLEGQPFSPYGREADLTWRRVACAEDHFVDLSTFHHTPHHLQAWAFCVVDSPRAQTLALSLTTNGPADLWLNGQHIQRVAHFHHQLPGTVSFDVQLTEGHNEILVRFEAVALRECPYTMALQLDPGAIAQSSAVLLPSAITPADRRQKLQKIFDAAYLDRDVFTRNDKLIVHWPEGAPVKEDFALRLERQDGRIYSEQHTEGEERASASLGVTYQFPEDEYQILLFPNPQDYYAHGLRVDRRLDVFLTGNKSYSTERYDTYTQRREEALWDAARRLDAGHLFAEIATMELGRWGNLRLQVIHDTIDFVNRRSDCSDFYLVGLLGLAARYIDQPGFPAELVDPLRDCFLNFRYWIDEPGKDAMCFWSENHQILFHTCEILAGQLLPDETFPNAGLSGSQHRAKGERMALAWLRKRAAGGFREWDSNTYFEHDVLALSHLVDLAESDDVRELAAVVLDKMLFGLAVNSYRGVFGSTHGRTYSPFIKGAYQEPTSGISRLLWGKGIFNQHILGTVSLACAHNYQLPPVIEAIALDPAEEIWSRERHAGQLEEWCDQMEGSWEVNKVTYKTPDFMLASAQDHQPGEPGYQQHIWQATLSPEAVVFVTHPPCISEDGAHRSNFWHGNVLLPRVAQWKDLLVAVHRLPADDWLGFTHAYFPLYAFDEYAMRDGWACARVGDGYLALTAARGLELIQTGRNAFRELRSHGQHNTWLVQMGRAAQDGSFAEFVEKVSALDVTFEESSVHLRSLRGESIDFGWEGPLLVDEQEQPLSGFLHFDGPYSRTELDAEKMDIRFQDLLVRLDFS